MPLYFKDVVDDPQRLNIHGFKQGKCCICGVVLQETITGKRKTPDGPACSACYYGAVGEEIERHPIASAGIRRT